MKTCNLCGIEKPFSEFHADKRRGYSSRCKPCNTAAVAAWRKKNRESYNASERKRYAESTSRWAQHIQRKYGITANIYNEMFERQGHACAICRRKAEELGQTLSVDHDHDTGAVRGLLCAKCNRMLGCAIDRPDVLRDGADYLINAAAAQAWIETVMECIG